MQLIKQAGLIISVLIFVVIGLLRIREARKQNREKLSAGTWLDAAGFGFLPAVAAWKAFEPYCGQGTDGKKLFDPLAPIPFLTRDERFAPDRIELIAAVAAFVLIAVWLIARKQELPGNGDLFLSVICVWSAVRMTTESLREFTARYDGYSIVMMIAAAAEVAVMAVWTVRRGRKHKNAAMTIMEWLTLLACGIICILQDAEVLSMGSRIANLAVTVGCSILAAALILSAGKDSREA